MKRRDAIANLSLVRRKYAVARRSKFNVAGQKRPAGCSIASRFQSRKRHRSWKSRVNASIAADLERSNTE